MKNLNEHWDLQFECRSREVLEVRGDIAPFLPEGQCMQGIVEEHSRRLARGVGVLEDNEWWPLVARTVRCRVPLLENLVGGGPPL